MTGNYKIFPLNVVLKESKRDHQIQGGVRVNFDGFLVLIFVAANKFGVKQSGGDRTILMIGVRRCKIVEQFSKNDY
jgi:hypothetical protein